MIGAPHADRLRLRFLINLFLVRKTARPIMARMTTTTMPGIAPDGRLFVARFEETWVPLLAVAAGVGEVARLAAIVEVTTDEFDNCEADEDTDEGEADKLGDWEDKTELVAVVDTGTT
jgi:hypothetical protein